MPAFSRLLSRTFLAVFGVGAQLAVAAETVTVTEYYNKDLDSYFITGRADEQQALDTVAAFSRTGAAFVALPATAATSKQTRICRFYISIASAFTSSRVLNFATRNRNSRAGLQRRLSFTPCFCGDC